MLSSTACSSSAMLPELSSTRMISTGSLISVAVALVVAQVSPGPGTPPVPSLVLIEPAPPVPAPFDGSMLVAEPAVSVEGRTPEPEPAPEALQPATKSITPAHIVSPRNAMVRRNARKPGFDQRGWFGKGIYIEIACRPLTFRRKTLRALTGKQ